MSAGPSPVKRARPEDVSARVFGSRTTTKIATKPPTQTHVASSPMNTSTVLVAVGITPKSSVRARRPSSEVEGHAALSVSVSVSTGVAGFEPVVDRLAGCTMTTGQGA
jgi:hypothetical protein